MKQNNKPAVDRNTNLGKLLWKHPEVEEVLLDYELHCVHCMANSYDSVEAGAKIHGYSDEEIVELIGRLNEVIEHQE